MEKTLAFLEKVCYHGYLVEKINPLGWERMKYQMSPLMIVLTVVYVVFCLFLIAVVLLQSGKSAGLSGAIAGGMDTFLSKNKAKTWDARLAKMTKWVAVLFMVLTLVLCLFL